MESAVYARQSVEKKNSLSIEGQIDLCRRAANRELQIYRDSGFSGKNTQRPDFQRLMRDIKANRIDKLYVYRLDRFSRSVADFGRLWEILQAHHVQFVSVSESFDTSSPMGRAMLHIIMVFAQLERETTAERVKDNYYKRASLGAWPGGPAPFGFHIGRRPDKTGRPVPTLVIDPAAAKIVRRVFELYALDEESLGTVARILNEEHISGPKRDTWDSVSISRLIRCPAYVRADQQIRLHYIELGASITSEPAAFDGVHGLLLVGKRDRARKTYADTQKQSVSVLNSEGIVDPELWLACQRKLKRNRQIGNSGKGTHTWLTGTLKCAACGYSLKVAQNRSGRYLNCSGRYNLAKCTASIHIDLTELENMIAERIQAMLDECPDTQSAPAVSDDGITKRLDELEQRAARLIGAFSASTEMTSAYLNRAIEQIELERRALLEAGQRKCVRRNEAERLVFSSLSFDDKKTAAAQFIRRISISGEDVEVYWNV